MGSHYLMSSVELYLLYHTLAQSIDLGKTAKEALFVEGEIDADVG